MTPITIDYLPGFAEVTSFSRPFTRWTGVSPSEYRIRAEEFALSHRL